MDEHKTYQKADDPICYEVRQDCFMYRYGVCKLLTSTHFRRGKCPFYKSVEQAAVDTMKAENRLYELGIKPKKRK